MIAGILKETASENRVSILPEQVDVLRKMNVETGVEESAGERAFATDNAYIQKNAIIAERKKILQTSDILLSIHPLSHEVILHVKPGVVLLGVYQPLFNYVLMQQWAQKQITTFSIDIIPRTTRAQSMDVLSSQANIAGYKAVLLAASLYPKYLSAACCTSVGVTAFIFCR